MGHGLQRISSSFVSPTRVQWWRFDAQASTDCRKAPVSSKWCPPLVLDWSRWSIEIPKKVVTRMLRGNTGRLGIWEIYKILRTAYRVPFSVGTPRIFLRALARSLGFPSFLIPLIINWSKFDLADRVAPFHFAYSHPARYLSLSLSLSLSGYLTPDSLIIPLVYVNVLVMKVNSLYTYVS